MRNALCSFEFLRHYTLTQVFRMKKSARQGHIQDNIVFLPLSNKNKKKTLKIWQKFLSSVPGA
jgi:hypothetical protein